ncbi:MAG: prepilin-type N-terminal cleavage/methylation domain-containing protein [Candidatus Saganbacteria bacterium]|nr:prepilin-type N-terminal cleavage/methylation domain-containing protein [Candidatus Saganbacteria bacterium]
MRPRLRGFTLIEMIIAFTLLAMVMGGIFHAASVELAFWQRVALASTRQQAVDHCLGSIVRDIHSAGEIIFSATGDELILLAGPDRIEYSLNSGKLCRKKNGRAAYLTDVGQVGQFSVSYPSTRRIEFMLDEYIGQAALRN